jgi:murein DD-endopeptidase MepM/ murein hydrolase activator NlpD
VATSVNPKLLQAIRTKVPKHLQPIILATALVESGGRLDASAAGPEDSEGPYQENIKGRGAGLSVAQRRDPVGSTVRAAREFQTFYDRGARGPSLAYRAQRPADQAGYIKKIAAALPTAQQLLGAGAGPVPPAGSPAPGAQEIQKVAGSLDAKKLMALLNQQRKRVLAGQMPSANYRQQLTQIAQQALPRAQVAAAGASVGAQAAQAGQAVSKFVGGLTMGGGPEAHGSRALGNWQSDNAFDLMGKAGQPVYSPVAGTVVKISGQPGGKPGFAGYGITVRTAKGDLFFKHLGSANVKVGQKFKPGTLIGTLDPSTAGGPHLHLGGTNRAFLNQLAKLYTT